MTRPALIITGTKDKSLRNGKSYEWRRRSVRTHSAARLLSADDRRSVPRVWWHHRKSPSPRPGFGPANQDHVDYVRTTSLAFWDYYLKEKQVAQRTLQTDHIAKASKKQAKLTWKQKSP